MLCNILSSFTGNMFSSCKKVAFGVWGLRTSFGPIGAKRLTNKAISAEPFIQFLQTRPHFMQNFKLDKMFYLNIRTCYQLGV